MNFSYRQKLGTLCILLFIFQRSLSQQSADSISVESSRVKSCLSNFHFTLSISSSISFFENWLPPQPNILTLSNDLALRNDRDTGKLNLHFLLRESYSYSKYVDSIWRKTTDLFDVSIQLVKNSPSKATQSFSFLMHTQFTAGYFSNYNSQSLKFEEVKIGGFLNPGDLQIGYGLNFTYWQNCRLNISFATIKISTQPTLLADTSKKENLFMTKNAVIYSSYGLGTQLYIHKQLSNRFSWDNTSVFFSNGISENNFSLDLDNRFTYSFWKFVAVQSKTRIVYTPTISLKAQFLQEFVLSFLVSK